MALSFASKILALMLSVALSSAIFFTVLSQTLLSSQYLEQNLATTNSYNRLSDALSDEIAHNVLGTTELDPALVAQLKTIVAPDVLKTKVNGALEQFEAYAKGKGGAPVIDLSDIAAQAQAAGIPIGTDNEALQPITIGNGPGIQQANDTFATSKNLAIISSVVLAIALLVVSWRRNSYAALPNVLIVVGLMVGLVALLCLFAPGIIDKHVRIDFSANAFGAIGHDLAQAIVKDLGKRFGTIAVVILAIGIGTRVALLFVRKKNSSLKTTA
jgi:hypothetical protein